MADFIKIRYIRKYLTTDACMDLVFMLCISHLNYGNTFLYDLPRKITK